MAENFLEKINWSNVRNAVFGFLVVFGGLGLAFITLWAQWQNNPRLAGAAAIASLVFVVVILLFVVPPLARSASREVASFDLPLELTLGGLIFLGIIAIVGFSAWNTGNNLLFLVLSFLLSSFTVSLMLGSSNLKKLEARVRFPEAIFANEPTIFTVELKNKKWLLPSFSIAVSLRGATALETSSAGKFRFFKPRTIRSFSRANLVKRIVGYFIHVPRRKNTEQQTEQIFPVRGQFIIKDFELATLYPFGFWRQRKRLQVVETTIYVFPRLEDVRGLVRNSQRQIGQFTTPRRGAGQDLLGLREYQNSDDIRRVDWKATALVGQLTVRDFASDDERRVSIILISTADAARFERGVALAASLAAYYIAEKAEIKLVTQTDQTDFGIGKAHLHELLRRLSIIEAKEKPSETEFEIPASEGELQIIVAPAMNEIQLLENRVLLPY